MNLALRGWSVGLLLAFAGALNGWTGREEAEPKKPNIVMIVADDLGWKDLGWYGSIFYESPRIDRLAAEGMRFTNAYSAAPVCSPSRAAILTGRSPARVGVTGHINPTGAHRYPPKGAIIPPDDFLYLPSGEITIAEALKVSGYRTLCVGKWHLGSEVEHQAPPALVKKYQRKLAADGAPKSAVYAAMVENLDSNVGRLLEAIEQLGLAQDTLVIFTSDNGGASVATNNHPLRQGKGYLYEGGVRVPLIVKWPGKVRPGTQSDVPVIGYDLLPTILEMTGISIDSEHELDGRSLVPVLTGSGALARRRLYFRSPPPQSPQEQDVERAAAAKTVDGLVSNFQLIDFAVPSFEIEPVSGRFR